MARKCPDDWHAGCPTCGESDANAFTVKIKTDNAAFEDVAELPRILRELADDVERNGGGNTYTLRDINGNTVGKAGQQ